MISAGSSLATKLTNPNDSIIPPDTICLETSEFDSLALLIVEGEEYKMKYLYMSERYVVQSDVHKVQMSYALGRAEAAEKDQKETEDLATQRTVITVVIVGVIQQALNFFWQKLK